MKTILVLSDLHVGGYRSIWPQDATVEVGPGERQIWQLTRGQEYLWECWNHLLTTTPKRFDAVIVNGDVIQGHRDPWSTKLCASNINDQIRAAVQLLTPLRKRTKHMYLTAGTKYHNLDYADAEQLVADKLHAKHLPWLNLRIGGKLINAVHGHTTAFVYRSTNLEREIMFAAQAEVAHQTPRPDILIRSHIHFFITVMFRETLALFTPSWQLPDESLAIRLASFYKPHPILGAVMLEINGRDKSPPAEVIPLAYDTPQWNNSVEEI
jgi:hypothetical protein